jgi:hypothetical protein
MKITLNIPPIRVALLATLDESGSVKAVVEKLIDHAQQGVYRPGAWEREWLIQAFGDDFISKLEPGSPWTGSLDSSIRHFQRPKKEGK